MEPKVLTTISEAMKGLDGLKFEPPVLTAFGETMRKLDKLKFEPPILTTISEAMKGLDGLKFEPPVLTAFGETMRKLDKLKFEPPVLTTISEAMKGLDGLNLRASSSRKTIWQWSDANRSGFDWMLSSNGLTNALYDSRAIASMSWLNALGDQLAHSVGSHASTISSQVSAIERALRAPNIAFADWRHSPGFLASFESSSLWAQPFRERFVSCDLLAAIAAPAAWEDIAEDRAHAINEVEEYVSLTLPPAISRINPRLFQMWEGAWYALRSSNPDKVRHCLVSARELVTQVLHALAPDEEVLSLWSEEPYVHDGKPTRRGRLRFIAMALRPTEMQTFMTEDLGGHLALLTELQGGTHRILNELGDEQLRIMLRKVHTMICSLVEMKAMSAETYRRSSTSDSNE